MKSALIALALFACACSSDKSSSDYEEEWADNWWCFDVDRDENFGMCERTVKACEQLRKSAPKGAETRMCKPQARAWLRDGVNYGYISEWACNETKEAGSTARCKGAD